MLPVFFQTLFRKYPVHISLKGFLLIDDLSKNRIEELRVIRENREAENAILSKLLIPPLCGDESRAEETESEGTQHDADGSSTEDKRTE